ncbi:MAG: hypothetical protein PHX83_11015 [Acidobacteriia bacterium]|nr:hypothetical protein [Terriglobia bacterium]
MKEHPRMPLRIEVIEVGVDHEHCRGLAQFAFLLWGPLFVEDAPLGSRGIAGERSHDSAEVAEISRKAFDLCLHFIRQASLSIKVILKEKKEKAPRT